MDTAFNESDKWNSFLTNIRRTNNIRTFVWIYRDETLFVRHVNDDNSSESHIPHTNTTNMVRSAWHTYHSIITLFISKSVSHRYSRLQNRPLEIERIQIALAGRGTVTKLWNRFSSIRSMSAQAQTLDYKIEKMREPVTGNSKMLHLSGEFGASS